MTLDRSEIIAAEITRRNKTISLAVTAACFVVLTVLFFMRKSWEPWVTAAVGIAAEVGAFVFLIIHGKRISRRYTRTQATVLSFMVQGEGAGKAAEKPGVTLEKSNGVTLEKSPEPTQKSSSAKYSAVCSYDIDGQTHTATVELPDPPPVGQPITLFFLNGAPQSLAINKPDESTNALCIFLLIMLLGELLGLLIVLFG